MSTNGSNGSGNITGHFQLVYPTEYIKACDLKGRDVTVVIAAVKWEKLVMEGGRKDTKAVVHMTNVAGRALGKRWVVGKTVLKQIGASTGESDVGRWIGKRVTMYPTTCKGKAGETMECIRVRVKVAQGATEIPEDMAAAPAPRDFVDEAGDEMTAPPDEPVGEAQALHNRLAAAKSERDLNLIAADFETVKRRLLGSVAAELRRAIDMRRESLAGVVPAEAEPPAGGA